MRDAFDELVRAALVLAGVILVARAIGLAP